MRTWAGHPTASTSSSRRPAKASKTKSCTPTRRSRTATSSSCAMTARTSASSPTISGRKARRPGPHLLSPRGQQHAEAEPPSRRAAEPLFRRRFHVLRRNRGIRTLGLPVHGHNPPSRAVVQQLNAVDTARERLGVVGLATRFIRAEPVRDGAEGLAGPRDLALEEAVALQIGTRRARVLVRRHRPSDCLSAVEARWDEPRPWREERAKTIPVAGLTRRTRDHVVERRDLGSGVSDPRQGSFSLALRA